MRPTLVILLLASAASTAIAFSASRLSSAYAQVEATERRLKRADSNIAEIRSLRDKQAVLAVGARPDQDVISLVLSVLSEVGIPSEQFSGLDRDSDAALRGSSGTLTRYRKQSHQLRFHGLAPRQIGAFLGEWRQRQNVWVPERIEIQHERQQPEPQRLYALGVLITAVYLSDRVEDSR